MQQNSPLRRAIFSKKAVVALAAFLALLVVGNYFSSRSGGVSVTDDYYTSGAFVRDHMDKIPQFEMKGACQRLFYGVLELNVSRRYPSQGSCRSKPRLHRCRFVPRQRMAAPRALAVALVPTPKCQDAALAYLAHVF